MKLIINSYTNRIKLIKFFRSFHSMDISLSDATYRTDHLPFTYELSRGDIEEIREQIKDFTEFDIEEEDDYGSICYNGNISPPPQEYLDALAWYQSCSEEHQRYIDQIAIWRSRPAVC